jgi:hypothetical protein
LSWATSQSNMSTGRRQQFSLPDGMDSSPAPNSYDLGSSMGKGHAVSFKGDRQREFGMARDHAVFLLPNLANKSPAPNSYRSDSSFGNFGPSRSSSFGISKRFSRFNGDKNATFLVSEARDSGIPGPSAYTADTAFGRSNAGTSFSRSKRHSHFIGDKQATFLVPEEKFNTPGPTRYNTREKFGSSAPGSTFGRAKRYSRFNGDKNAVFLLMEQHKNTPSPARFDWQSDHGASSPHGSAQSDQLGTMTSSSLSRLEGNHGNGVHQSGYYTGAYPQWHCHMEAIRHIAQYLDYLVFCLRIVMWATL